MVYFYDENKRYIGCRQGDDKPANSTNIPVTLADGQEAHFIDGAWVVSDIVIELVENVPTEPTLEEKVNYMEETLTDKGVLP